MVNLFSDGKLLFATSYRNDEIECLKEIKPPHLLTSFAMWRNKSEDKDLENNLIKRIEYKPTSIYVDCGSYTFGNEDYGLNEMIESYQEMREEDGFSFDLNNEDDINRFSYWYFGQFEECAYNNDKNQFCLFEQYLNFLWQNQKCFNYCFAFDRIGDNNESLLAYRIMNALGFNVIPVYQATHISPNKFGNLTITSNTKDLPILDYYAAKTDYIAIGGTAHSKVKGYKKRDRIEIVNRIIDRYPEKKFHLLGTLDSEIMDACPRLYSVDGTAWVQKVKNNKIIESKKYLNDKIVWFESKKGKNYYLNQNNQLEFIL
ncbi:hypothetical protein [Cytobacillus praedii]|uniref:hypothetical protein n=1 Tax=Cytobacillus praedii TaxID=1742358 RepID=UPI002E20D4F9|nr:hypothetical protein [Cytobacillus praedii]